jgi:hypothetical protein
MKIPRSLLLLCLTVAAVASASAQITVDLSIKRRLFIANEPLIATVTVNNLTGRDITLADTPQMPWFSFQVNGRGERIIGPRNPNYGLDPLEIKAGGSMRRSVNLNELYQIADYGIYRIRANIYFAEAKKFFSSKPTAIEITDGRLLWKRNVGSPSDDGVRTFSILGHQQGEYTVAYVRVEDREKGTVYCVHELGRMLEGQPPLMEFDLANNLYVLQLVGQRDYVLSKIGINGEYLGQTRYSAPKSRMYLRKLDDGQLQVVGGRRVEEVAQNPAIPPTKLSDRPPGLPK